MKSVKITLLCLLPGLAACEKEAQQYYEVANTARFSITVVSTDVEEPNIIDTTVIPAGQTLSIALLKHGRQKVEKAKETGDRISNLTRLDVYRDGTLKARQDFLDMSHWTYEERDKYIAYYTLEVEATDF